MSVKQVVSGSIMAEMDTLCDFLQVTPGSADRVIVRRSTERINFTTSQTGAFRAQT
jgi:hypothetical protein